MQENGLYDAIRDRGGMDTTDDAQDAAMATLHTLGERITGGQAADLADYLPDELAGAVAGPGGEAEEFGPREFVDRVADREAEADQEAAQRHVRATMETLGVRVNRLQWRDVRGQLPEEYASLYERKGETDGRGGAGGHAEGREES